MAEESSQRMFLKYVKVKSSSDVMPKFAEEVRIVREAIVVEGYVTVSAGVAAWRVSSSHER